MAEGTELMTVDNICNRVYIIRGQQVMLDYDLAEIYGYEVKRLNEQVKNNISRFPEDFMFQLLREEVPEDVWNVAQENIERYAKKYEHINKQKNERVHMLSGIIKCPVCGAGMYGNKSIKHRKDGTRYRDFFYYGCKHRNMTRGHKCDYKKQINEELIDSAVSDVIKKLVSNPKFAELMREKINMQVDTSELEQQIANYEKQLRQNYNVKDNILADIDALDYEDKHYKRRKSDLEDRLYKVYDRMDEIENALLGAKTKKRSIMADKVTGDNIYKALIYFEDFYDKMNESERRECMTVLLDNVQVYEERQPNGQWLKSMEFKLLIIREDMKLRLDNGSHVETVVSMSKKDKWM